MYKLNVDIKCVMHKTGIHNVKQNWEKTKNKKKTLCHDCPCLGADLKKGTC